MCIHCVVVCVRICIVFYVGCRCMYCVVVYIRYRSTLYCVVLYIGCKCMCDMLSVGACTAWCCMSCVVVCV